MESQPRPSAVSPAYIAQRARANVLPATVGAALLMYFGFVALAEPTGSDLFSKGALVFYHTLRIGGVAMAVLAVWSLVGHKTALLADALVSVPIGGLFILSGAMMIADGGALFQSAINFVCGFMFIGAGTRNWRDYAALSGEAHTTRDPNAYDPRFEERYAEVRDEPPGDSLASRLRDRAAEPAEPTPPPVPLQPTDSNPYTFGGDLDVQEDVAADSIEGSTDLGRGDYEQEIGGQAPEPTPADDEPPDGFLSSFSDENRP